MFEWVSVIRGCRLSTYRMLYFSFLSFLFYRKYLARDDFLVEPIVFFIELAPPVCFSASIILASGFLSPRVMPDLGESGSQHNRQLGKKFRKSSFLQDFDILKWKSTTICEK